MGAGAREDLLMQIPDAAGGMLVMGRRPATQ
jgi:hypothetical protein